MKLRIKFGLLVCLIMSSGYLATKALQTITPAASAAAPYEEVYAGYATASDSAEYYLRDYDGYVGVFASNRGGIPVEVTDIELSCLRDADRAMIRSGLPVSDRTQLLTLLEDLGS